MPTRSPSPTRQYSLFDLAEDFREGLIFLMSDGFSVHSLDYVLDPLDSDVLSGDPPPAGEERFHLSWGPLPGFSLPEDLNQALIGQFPVRAIQHKVETVTDDWDRLQKYILFSLAMGEV